MERKPVSPSLSQQMQAPARSDVVGRMADFITNQVAANGNVTRDDLLLSFSNEQIQTHFEAAKKRASRQ